MSTSNLPFPVLPKLNTVGYPGKGGHDNLVWDPCRAAPTKELFRHWVGQQERNELSGQLPGLGTLAQWGIQGSDVSYLTKN